MEELKLWFPLALLYFCLFSFKMPHLKLYLYKISLFLNFFFTYSFAGLFPRTAVPSLFWHQGPVFPWKGHGGVGIQESLSVHHTQFLIGVRPKGLGTPVVEESETQKFSALSMAA